MKKISEGDREIRSCRVGRAANTRLIRSSQMPKDFFSSHNSMQNVGKARCSEDCGEDRQIFE